MKLSWFRFYPRDWVSDQVVRSMTLEQRGAYMDMLCYLWLAKGGKCVLPDDDRTLSLLMGTRIDVWKRRLKPSLQMALNFDGSTVSSDRLRSVRKEAEGTYDEKSEKSPRKVGEKSDFLNANPLQTNNLGGVEAEAEADKKLCRQEGGVGETTHEVPPSLFAGDAASPPPVVSPVWPDSLSWLRAVVIPIAERFGVAAYWDDPAHWQSVEALVDSFPGQMPTRFADQVGVEFAEFLTYWSMRKTKRKNMKRTWINRVKQWHDFQLSRERKQHEAQQQWKHERPGIERRR